VVTDQPQVLWDLERILEKTNAQAAVISDRKSLGWREISLLTMLSFFFSLDLYILLSMSMLAYSQLPGGSQQWWCFGTSES
jgi:hypothetical protein